MSDQKPFLSFVVPFAATHSFLELCVNSVAQFCSLPYEVIIIDDGNDDYNFLSFQSDPAIRLIHNSDRQGPGYSRNIGVAAARGEFIMFLDSDDTLIADPVVYFGAETGQNIASNVDLITGKLEEQVLGPQFKIARRFSSLRDEPALIKIASFTAHLYRRIFLQRHAIEFPLGLTTAEDTVFLVRVMVKARVVMVTDTAVYRYRVVANSLSRSKSVQYEARFGEAALLIASALTDHPETRRVKLSVIFKYAVTILKKEQAHSDQLFTRLVILADLVAAGDIADSEANTARAASHVYWDKKWDQLVNVLAEGELEIAEELIAGTDFKFFKNS